MSNFPSIDSYRNVPFKHSKEGQSKLRISFHNQKLDKEEFSAILVGHRGSICTISFSPDSSKIVSADITSTLLVWDYNSLEQLKKYSVPGKLIHCLTFSKDSRLLASACISNKCEIQIWDFYQDEPLHTIQSENISIDKIIFNSDLNHIFIQDFAHSLWQCEIQSEQLEFCGKYTFGTQISKNILALKSHQNNKLHLSHGFKPYSSVQPYGNELDFNVYYLKPFVITNQRKMKIWNTRSQPMRLIRKMNQKISNDITIQTHQKVLTLTNENKIIIYELHTGCQEFQKCAPKTRFFSRINLDNNEICIANGFGTNKLKVWKSQIN